MKKAIDILYAARQQGIEILLNGTDLNVRIPKGKVVDEALIHAIRSNKTTLIEVLQNHLQNKAVEDDRITPYDKRGVSFIPASFSQERLWFIHKMEGSLQYHLSKQLLLQGKVDTAALSFALQQVVQRHQVLRTVLPEQEGRPYQKIIGAEAWSLEVEAAPHAGEQVLQQLAAQKAGRPFDLETDYMLRATLFMVEPQRSLLLLTMHHIAADGWSFPIVVQELVTLYQQYQQGQTAGLPALPLQFTDYAIWERNHLTPQALEPKLAYWRNQLQGVAPLQLPTDFERPQVRSAKGASVTDAIDQQLAQQLATFARQQGCTLYMVMLAVFKALLYRYTHQTDICVGASIANRSREEIRELVGFFVNTLSFRTEVEGSLPFTQLVQRVKQTTTEAYQQQDVPFEKVVEAVLTERDQSRTPLFQVMLVLNNTPATPPVEIGGLQITQLNEEIPLSKFDFTFFLSEGADGIGINAVYSTELFTAATMRRLVQHYIQLLRSAMQQPATTVGTLAMLTAAEQQALVAGWQSPAVDLPKGHNLATLFEACAARTPGAVAVQYGDSQLTFSQLNQQANQLAHRLIHMLPAGNQPIPVFLNRSAHMVVALLGIIKAGHAYVPIETDLPAERIHYLLNDLGATCIVTAAPLTPALALQQGLQWVLVDDVSLGDMPAANPGLSIHPEAMAYIIYTSGSTGLPKGVMVTHANIIDYVWGLNQRLQVSQCNSYALVSSFATDLGNTVLFSALLLGGALHVFSKEQVASSNYLVHYFLNHPIDCLKIVPSHWRALCTDGQLLLPEKMLIFGGEALPASVVQQVMAAKPGCAVINHYGPTETTIGKLVYRCHSSVPSAQNIPIGQPFGNTSIALLSADMQPCPTGVPAQLYIAGEGVAKGYWNNETLTQQKFLQVEAGGRTQRMYATGDLVKQLDTGDLVFIGRVDDQVKIRGYRVETGEVEAVLRTMPGVQLCAVTAPADSHGSRRLLAYVAGDERINPPAVIAYLQGRLPDYMVPAQVVVMDELPLTINGKIDKRALPQAGIAQKSTAPEESPRTAQETQLAAMWQQLLELPQVGIHEDFFALGGHSLLAVRLISMIRKSFGVELPISYIFDYPTIAQLATHLQGNGLQQALPPLEPVVPRPGNIPLSFSQERLWFIDQLEGSLQYHVPAVIRLQGTLHTGALQQALAAVVDRHEVLRTVFVQQNDQVLQVVNDAGRWTMETTLHGHQLNGNGALQQLIQQFINRPFNLAADYMMRALLIPCGPQQHILVINLHHIASDGWSRSILMKEIAALYGAFVHNTAPALPPLPVQFADYALWLNAHVKGQVLEDKLAYWKQKLQGVESLQFAADYARRPLQARQGGTVNFKVDGTLLQQLHALASAEGASLFMTLMAAFKVTLYKYTGQRDFCVGTPYAGRNQLAQEPLIGFFLNLLAIRSPITSAHTFTQYLQQVRADVMQAFEHQEVPFEKVVETVVTQRDLSATPLFQVMFMFQNNPDAGSLQFPGLSMTFEDVEANTARYQLTLTMKEAGGILHGAMEYNAALFSHQRIEQLVRHYLQLLQVAAANPGQTIAALNPLTTVDYQLLLQQYNQTAIDFSIHQNIIQWFEQTAGTQPNATALVCGGQPYTFAQLNGWANAMATGFIQQGVQPGTQVPVYIERSADMVAAILAIAKTGGVYVPLDPDYPAERIRFIVEDGNAAWVVTTPSLQARFQGHSGVQVLLAVPYSHAFETAANTGVYVPLQQAFCRVYTSGSTGTPKSVTLTHANILNRIHWNKHAYPFAPGERVAIKTSIGFVDHISELFATLCLGAAGVVFSKNNLLNPLELVAGLHQHRVTRWVLVPSLLDTMLDHLYNQPGSLPHLTFWASSGEALSAETVKKFYEVFSPETHRLVNIYGCSEVTADATYFDTRQHVQAAAQQQPAGGVPIGKPLSNCRVYVLDADDNLVPPGCYGEICVAGVQVCNGYDNQPGLTAGKFKPVLFDEANGTMYKTGDAGRWLANGNLEYAGRIDSQVKVNGNRVEPAEIENVLLATGLVKQVVVIPRAGHYQKTMLVGYVVADHFNRTTVVQALMERLPRYMIPTVWVQKPHLPLTPSGKIDRRALHNEPLAVEAAAGYVAASTPTEEALTNIWRSLLAVEKIGVQDDFFELGGHSLLVIRLVSAIKQQFNLAVPVTIFFQLTNISQLAAYIDWQLRPVPGESEAGLEVFNL